MHREMMCGSHGLFAVHAVVALYALIAALGYWTMQHAAKETANCVKRTGSVLGTALVVIGLLGVLCGIASHVKRSMFHHGTCCGAGMMQGDELEDGAAAPMAAGMGGMPGMRGKKCGLKPAEPARKVK